MTGRAPSGQALVASDEAPVGLHPAGFDPSRIPALIAMQQGEAKRPFLCRIGFHRFYRVRWLLTTGNAVCSKCGAGLMISLFGDFDCDRSESVKMLREFHEGAGRQTSPNA